MRLRTTRMVLSDRVSLLDNEGMVFAMAAFRVTDTPDDVIDQLEWLLRAAREHVEGIE
jgi:hypothetical protein